MTSRWRQGDDDANVIDIPWREVPAGQVVWEGGEAADDGCLLRRSAPPRDVRAASGTDQSAAATVNRARLTHSKTDAASITKLDIEMFHHLF